jgi:hypothetical protein
LKAVNGFRAQGDECLFATDVTGVFQGAQVQVEAAIRNIEPPLQGHEIQCPIEMKRGEDAKANGPMHSRIEPIEVNDWRSATGGS